MDSFGRALNKIFLRGSVIGIRVDLNLFRLRENGTKGGFLNVDFSIEFGVRKCDFIGVFDF